MSSHELPSGMTTIDLIAARDVHDPRGGETIPRTVDCAHCGLRATHPDNADSLRGVTPHGADTCEWGKSPRVIVGEARGRCKVSGVPSPRIQRVHLRNRTFPPEYNL
jgi:hypothetical protein